MGMIDKDQTLDIIKSFVHDYRPETNGTIIDIYEAVQKMDQAETPDMLDQSVKADYGKEQLTLVPRRIIHDICAIRMYGTEKYGDPENWKKVEKERYRDAAFRHFLKYLDDPDGVDEESGFPHLWHLACNIAFLCEMEDEDEQH